MSLQPTLGGLVCIRNGLRLDYCFREAVKSLLPICDKVLIVDCESDDGTKEWIDNWARVEPKLMIGTYPWTDPKADSLWWPRFVNFGREHLPTTHFIQLDADEVLFEQDHDEVKRAAISGEVLYVKRLNFWGDAWHLIPEGFCCGTKCCRVAPTNCPIPSDYPYEPANSTAQMAKDSNVRIGHYGFLRHREQFFIKARAVHKIWFNSFDPRLEAAEKYEGNWATMPGVTGWEDRLVPYDGPHPVFIKPWLYERGYNIYEPSRNIDGQVAQPH